MIGRQYELSYRYPSDWEPEPLHVPAPPPRRRPRRDPDDHEAGDERDDLPGSHVIVIDLA